MGASSSGAGASSAAPRTRPGRLLAPAVAPLLPSSSLAKVYGRKVPEGLPLDALLWRLPLVPLPVVLARVLLVLPSSLDEKG